MTKLSDEKDFFYIEREYLEKLRKDGNIHVPDCNYEDDGRAQKFYYGPVINKIGIDYYAPVSHTQGKVMYITDGPFYDEVKYGEKLIVKNDKTRITEDCGNVDLRYMVPVVDPSLLTPFTPKSDFAQKQCKCINAKSDKICTIAENVYDNITSGEYPRLTKSSINFDKATASGWDYIDEKEARIEARQEAIKRANDRLLKAQVTSNISKASSEEELTK